MRRTQTLMRTLEALLDQAGERQWGYDLQQRTGIRSGALYPILRRLLAAGWLSDGWEDPSEVEGRPPRRYYELTPDGSVAARQLLVEAAEESRFSWLDARGLT